MLQKEAACSFDIAIFNQHLFLNGKEKNETDIKLGFFSDKKNKDDLDVSTCEASMHSLILNYLVEKQMFQKPKFVYQWKIQYLGCF